MKPNSIKNKIHFIGIGGIGVSSIAHYYLSENKKVTGSDLNFSETIHSLEKAGAETFIGKHSASNLKDDVDLVVYSPAVEKNNPELLKAKRKKIEIQSYPESVGELTKNYFTITIAGTHGKSTTTAMLALVLIDAGLDPTVIIGTKLKEFNDLNFRKGESKYLLVEACEYKNSFLHYSPDVAVITNIDSDHLDYFKNLENIFKSFNGYLNRLKNNGTIIANKDDKNTLRLLEKRNLNKVNFFSLNQEKNQNLRLKLKVPGKHNQLNALAAITVARNLGIKDTAAVKSLSSYSGSWRRFDVFELKNKKITIISDYAHHPKEIEATLMGAREKYKKRRIVCVFQPHQIERTEIFFNDFVSIFKKSPIDKLIIADIYNVAGRESKKDKKNITSRELASKVNSKNVVYLGDFKKIKEHLIRNCKEKDVLMIVGAGNIYNLFQDIKKYFE